MMREEEVVRDYLQRAHDRGGDWKMAMLMMAGSLLDAGEPKEVLPVATIDLDPALRMYADGEISLGRIREIITAWARGATYEQIIAMLPEYSHQ